MLDRQTLLFSSPSSSLGVIYSCAFLRSVQAGLPALTPGRYSPPTKTDQPLPPSSLPRPHHHHHHRDKFRHQPAQNQPSYSWYGHASCPGAEPSSSAKPPSVARHSPCMEEREQNHCEKVSRKRESRYECLCICFYFLILVRFQTRGECFWVFSFGLTRHA